MTNATTLGLKYALRTSVCLALALVLAYDCGTAAKADDASGVALVPPVFGGAQSAAPQTTPSKSAAPDATVDDAQKRVRDLYNQSGKTVSAPAPLQPPSLSPTGQLTKKLNQDDADIRATTARLFQQSAPHKAENPALAAAPATLQPPTITAPPATTQPASPPTMAAASQTTQSLTPPVFAHAAQTPPTVTQPNRPATPVAEVKPSPQPAAVQAAVKPPAAEAIAAAKPAEPANGIADFKKPATMPLATSAQPAADTVDVANDQQASTFLRNLAGNDGVALNLPDATIPADIPAPIHIDEAVAFALKNNFEVLAADEKSRGAYWDKLGGYAEYLPSAEMGYDTGPERSQPASINDKLGNRVLDNTHHRRDKSITIRQPFIDLSIISDILSVTDKQNIADTERLDVREGIAYDTVSIYLGLLQARLAVRLADDYKGYLDDLAKRMEARVAGGGAASADLDRIRGRATIAESARIEAVGDYQSNLTEFKRLTKIMPPNLVIPETLVPPIPATSDEALDRALKTNPSYVASLKKIDLAADDRNKSFANLLPKISGTYSNSYAFNAGGAAEGNPVDGVYPTQKTQDVLLVAQWDIGATSVTSGISAMAKKREQTMRMMDVRSRIEQSIRSGYTAINTAHKRETALQKSVNANQRVVVSFKEQYTNGGRSLFDLLDAYEQLYNARLNLMRVVIANAKAAYQVRRQMGELEQSIIGAEKR